MVFSDGEGMVTDRQVKLLMSETKKGSPLRIPAANAGMNAPTARKWRNRGVLPSAARKVRNWRTRRDPSKQDWGEIEAFLERDPNIQAKTVFDWLRIQQRHTLPVPLQRQALIGSPKL